MAHPNSGPVTRSRRKFGHLAKQYAYVKFKVDDETFEISDGRSFADTLCYECQDYVTFAVGGIIVVADSKTAERRSPKWTGLACYHLDCVQQSFLQAIARQQGVQTTNYWLERGFEAWQAQYVTTRLSSAAAPESIGRPLTRSGRIVLKVRRAAISTLGAATASDSRSSTTVTTVAGHGNDTEVSGSTYHSKSQQTRDVIVIDSEEEVPRHKDVEVTSDGLVSATGRTSVQPGPTEDMLKMVREMEDAYKMLGEHLQAVRDLFLVGIDDSR